ncbi:von Willebrand factor type A domain-containing protein, partial [Nemania sp. NC0429]
MNLFSAGITWDPREPIPHQYHESISLSAVVPDTHSRGKPAAHTSKVVRPKALNLDPVLPHQDASKKTFPSHVVKEIGRNVLPAVSISIAACIKGDIAEVTATQVFWNDADLPIPKGSYTFGLPNGCAVMGFTCRVGNDKVLKATARPKGEAREAFERAVASHATAALLDQNTPEVFTSSLGNIPPNTRIKTEITYAAILNRGFGDATSTTTLIIPTYLANRYGDRPVDLRGLDLQTQIKDIVLRIEVLESERIQSIKSSSHEILVERSTHIGQAHKWDDIGQRTSEIAIVTMKEHSNWLETDFILSIDAVYSKGVGGSEAWLEIHPNFEGQAAMMVTLPPWVLHFQNDTAEDGEILFLADRSGSMEDKMKNLKSAMQFFLKGIPVGRTFNIWCFGSNYQPLWTKSQVYGHESLRQALDFVEEELKADMGGTELLPALEAIKDARNSSLLCDVVILTDGEVWQLDETLSLVRKAHQSSKGKIRFFSLGLGGHVSHALVEGIAKQGGGCSEIVAGADTEGWEERVVAILRAALTHHVYDLSLDIGGLKGITSPENLRSLSPFNARRIFMLLEEGGIPENDQTTLTLVSDGKCIPIDISIIRTEKPGILIHTLSARAILNDIGRRTISYGAYESGAWSSTLDGQQDLSRLAEDLACKYSLPSEWTSLFLLQENGESSDHQAPAGTITQIVLSHSNRGLLRIRGLGSGGISPASGQKGTHSGATVQRIYTSKRGRKGPLDHFSLGTQSPYEGVPLCPPQSVRDEPPGKKIVSAILIQQAFDGSIANGVLKELPDRARVVSHSIKAWLCDKTHLDKVAIDLLASTALTVAFLEHSYQDLEDLWVMIQEKAIAYMRLQVPQPSLLYELMEHSRASLKQVNEQASSNPNAESPNINIQKYERKRGINMEDNNKPGSIRVPIYRAPI